MENYKKLVRKVDNTARCVHPYLEFFPNRYVIAGFDLISNRFIILSEWKLNENLAWKNAWKKMQQQMLKKLEE
jgi:hypothetical protein